MKRPLIHLHPAQDISLFSSARILLHIQLPALPYSWYACRATHSIHLYSPPACLMSHTIPLLFSYSITYQITLTPSIRSIHVVQHILFTFIPLLPACCPVLFCTSLILHLYSRHLHHRLSTCISSPSCCPVSFLFFPCVPVIPVHRPRTCIVFLDCCPALSFTALLVFLSFLSCIPLLPDVLYHTSSVLVIQSFPPTVQEHIFPS